MNCPVCKKSIRKGKLFIGYIHPRCLQSKRTNFTVKEAGTPAEMRQIEKLCLGTYGELDFIEMGRWYDVRKMKNVVAVKDRRVLGFASWKKEEDRLFLLVILTEPEYFRVGIATALLNKIKSIAQNLKVKSIIVPISNDDLISYVFYQKNGFRLSGIDLRLPEKRHGREKKGFWDLPCRDEFYLEYKLP